MLRYACYLLVLCSFVVAAKPAERIVALAPHIVENLYAIGAGERIVARLNTPITHKRRNTLLG